MKLYELTVHEARELLSKREISSEELTKAVLERIDQVEEKIRAFLTIDREGALEMSRKIDEEADFSRTLAGIPGAIKDNICTKNLKTTCASKILGNFIPPYDATVSKKLKADNAVILGKTNMDEFAMGSSTENSGFFITRNPWDLERVPGGSSGGSAAAVAAGECIFALGSDTGGSIRQPASYCGVVGLKPTYGRVSRYGLVAYASSLDQIGTITKDVTDCAIVLNAISGWDECDSTSVNMPVPDYTESLVADVKGMKIGLPKEYLGEGIDKEVREAVLAAARTFESLGAVCEEISLPHTEYALWAYYIIAPAEASSNLARYDGIRYGVRAVDYDDLIDLYKKTRSEGFGPEVKRRIMLGTYALSSGYYDAYYLKAQKVRTLVKRDFDMAFEKYDVIISPTAPTAAFRIGEKTGDPLKMYMSDVCTIPVNMAGLPAISVPCGFSNGMPVGLQIIGKAFDEATIIRAAYTFEQATDYHRKKPVL
ncbi:Asp-tRNA(Asn)/Glu-tRNA(Gln) amidotransferase subunit GatA [Thermosediminibacter oceani]|uniref:Glutamyl-tRNA(Gln) amidotransferase subunit A n=1 Tax=Thermosediminibacter oceani (strain ATCC BAA-1034 / DSM 16646 / JW/IW-1228P) TaxID=555079 RepID=D9S201_THEOJ|nr:Asp-tRNA(Asn)/Glu-tRNA(Gln) amidotransferase subunit GatA [Thermosediminibacter oceani]ADL07428.1 aspartyl/glutamyl-tRNA(Asn/Gln) amidotransferase subunit A [Thermosediminibacter oceani DSM 16646]